MDVLLTPYAPSAVQICKIWKPPRKFKTSRGQQSLESVRSQIGIFKLERTRDLMTPDVVRPLATSTLGHMIVVAHRLGMRWLDIRPSEGYMRAEGNGHNLTSTLTRGLGAVFKYNSENKPSPFAFNTLNGGGSASQWTAKKDSLIPTRQTDMLACGIIPGVGWGF